jgi:hypothetical protein
MKLVLDLQGESMMSDLYEIKTSESLTGLLLDYIYKWRLNKLFDNCIANAYDGNVVMPSSSPTVGGSKACFTYS